MKDYVGAPANLTAEIIRHHVEMAQRAIKNYTALVVLMDEGSDEPKRRLGSGVFVNAGGQFGILTAYHVAKAALANRVFGLSIRDYAHGLFIPSEHCLHVPIGWALNGEQGEDGPDLSVIVIRDKNLLSTLRSVKSFCCLETQDQGYLESPHERLLWCISGSPYEAAEVVGHAPDGGPIIRYSDFVCEAGFHSRVSRGEFDYIQLKVPVGANDYPKDCAGMSGGGMWIVPLSIEVPGELATIRHEAPLLAGISYYQSETLNGERIISGHGFDSIYRSVRKVLNEKTEHPVGREESK